MACLDYRPQRPACAGAPAVGPRRAGAML